MLTLRTVLFDLDGTLIDSVRLILDSYHHTLAAHGLPPRSDEEWLRGVGTPLTIQFAEWRGDPGTMGGAVAAHREKKLGDHHPLVPGLPRGGAPGPALQDAGGGPGVGKRQK